MLPEDLRVCPRKRIDLRIQGLPNSPDFGKANHFPVQGAAF